MLLDLDGGVDGPIGQEVLSKDWVSECHRITVVGLDIDSCTFFE